MQAQEKVVKDRLQNDASGEVNLSTRMATGISSRWKLQIEDYTVVEGARSEDAQDCFNVNNLLAAEKISQDPNAPAVPEKPLKARIVE